MRVATEHSMARKGAIRVLARFGPPCPVGYRAHDHFPVELPTMDEVFRCPAGQEAMEPYIDFMEDHYGPNELPPCRFVASCHCPVSPTEVVFSFYTYPTAPA